MEKVAESVLNSQGMKARTRLDFIDLCKAFGIVMVVLGHVYNSPEWLFTLIYSFHMPLFFVLTGYTFNREKNLSMGFGRFLLKKARQYLVPYYLFAFLNLGFQLVWKTLFHQEITADYVWINIKGILLCYSNMDNMPNCSPLWFLMCLFVASALFWWVMRLNEKWSWIPVLGCLLLNDLLSPFVRDYTSFPFKIPTALMAVFFLYIGYWMKKMKACRQTWVERKPLLGSLFVCALIIASFVLVLWTNNNVGMNENQYGNRLIFLITATILSAGFLFLAEKATVLHNRAFLWLGKNTIYIVAANYLCRDIALELYYLTPILRKMPLHWTVFFLYTMILCILCALVCSVVKKGKLRLMEKWKK